MSPVHSVTLQDMLDQSEFKYGALRGTLTFDNLRNSTHPTEQQIWRNMAEFSRADDSILSDDHDVNMARVRRGGFVYFEEYDVFAKLVSEECDLTVMEEPLYPMSYSIGLQRNSAYKPTMNRISLLILERGIVKKLFRHYFLSNVSCSDASLFSAHQPVTLSQMRSVFAVLGASLVIAGSALCVEVVLSCTSKACASRTRKSRHILRALQHTPQYFQTKTKTTEHKRPAHNEATCTDA